MTTTDAGSPAPAAASLVDCLLRNDRVAARALAERWAGQRGPFPFIDDVIVPALDEFGRRWETGGVALAQVYMAGRICELIVDELLSGGAVARRQVPRIAIAAVSDQHTMGKRVVSLAVRAAGFELVDYGAGVPADTLARRASADSIEVLLVSALMLSSALEIETISRHLARSGGATKLIVGGAPFRLDPTLWRRVGADAWGPSASDAVHLIADVRGES